nr:glucoamylase family protein [Paralcaligenes ureilyticus]
MEQHGQRLASSHKLSSASAQDQLLARLSDNERMLGEACALLLTAVEANRQVEPASEWLLDNFYFIEEQIRTAKRHLPKGYSRGLPRLSKGVSAGLPRVYDIALEITSHSDARLDPESLSRFVAAYQKITPLKLGELWAIPIMLRLALIENLRRVAVCLLDNRNSRNLAGIWADRMRQTAESDPTSLILVIADMARSDPAMAGSFVAELARRLQGQGPALALPLTWIEQRLEQSGASIEQLISAEVRQQAADQVSISNSIVSLRFLATMNWREFVETMSIVERILEKDPVGAYSQMDFGTRDRYRHSVERISKYSRFSEEQVAEKAIALATDSLVEHGDNARTGHVGFYLVDKGLATLERDARAKLAFMERVHRRASRAPLFCYLGGIAPLTLLFAGGLIAKAYLAGISGWALALMAALSVVGASHLGIALFNWLFTVLVQPKPLPRMDFSKGIPSESRTLVVVPTMLVDLDEIDNLSSMLEVRFLANQDKHLHFGLLTDFTDAQTEDLPQDDSLLERARDNINELNQKYSRGDEDIFFLFHRSRRWNPQDKIWMGYERKRGKLSDLNGFLRGSSDDAFSCVVGRTEALSNVKYVITLDTDTQLPRDAAWRLAGAMAHPLNQARYDSKKGRITEGYGILQPRVAASLPASGASLYAQLCSGEPGIDPYTRTVSDVYQDIFHEGSFIGKGVYDVDAFGRVLDHCIPENAVLSHDLLEGCYARCGLLSDVQLYEEEPSRYNADVSRRHRWIRGDWQLTGWLLPRSPRVDGKRPKNPLSALSRWKILDNLRRSIVPPALALLLILAWTMMPNPWFWTEAVLGILFIPPFMASLLDLLRMPDDVLLRQHLATSMQSAGRRFAQSGLTLACLPYEAFYSLDAVLRTLWRVRISHKRLLQWNPSSQPNHDDAGSNLGSAYAAMWVGPVLAAGTGFYLARWQPEALILAAPFLLLWLLSPALVWWLSRPLATGKIALTPKQALFLGRQARKMWAFFETWVGPDDNWLPPDNIQEHPVESIAHRTSPTNIGLALLANLAACDFGYIPAGLMMERTGNSLRTMAVMEQHQGHFYNWYDTQSLQPLHPYYISTVDSGNLAGHLLTLQSGLLGTVHQTIFVEHFFEGLRDAFNVLLGTLENKLPSSLAIFEKDLESACKNRPATLWAVRDTLDRMALATTLYCASLDPDLDPETSRWSQALNRQCQQACDELAFLAPWAEPGAPTQWLTQFPELNLIPTLHELSQYETVLWPELERQLESSIAPDQKEWLNKVATWLPQATQRAQERIGTLTQLGLQACELARMDYDFLYDKSNHLLTIGYNVDERRRDDSFYDLLASEARLCTFVGIAQGQLPQENWFSLGRQLTAVGGEPTLLSWSGSMFEYLMPLLVMPTFDKTLLDQTYKSMVKRQIEYGARRGVPWGVSESGFNTLDANLSYQYRAFGVPGLGLKRGLADDLVVAPYASMLALMVAPAEACRNLRRLSAEGFEGRFGFFEAIDFTPSRLPRGKSCAIIRSFMSHHQGMGFLSLAYVLLDRPMQKRFEADLSFQATLLLLHEKIPRAAASYAEHTELTVIRSVISPGLETSARTFSNPNTPVPEVQLLSNGRYHVMVSAAGSGYSLWKDLAITRWREDTTCDQWGTFCYLRDITGTAFWSTTYQPTLKPPRHYEVIFSEGRAEFSRDDADFDTHTEIVVSPEDDIELRRCRIINRSHTTRTIELTSYTEIVLAPAAADAVHPAFSNLFVQTEILQSEGAILGTRRARSPDEHPPWMFHLMAAHGVEVEHVSYETDRSKFLGRGNTLQSPQAMRVSTPLSGSQGSVLDPIAAIRIRITLGPHRTAVVDMVTGAAQSRDASLALIDKYQDRHLADRVFELSWTHSQVVLRQLNVTEADANLFGRLASSIIYQNPSFRAEASVLIQNRRGQSGLWSYAVSGDFPIVLLQIKDPANIDLVRQMVRAHTYWRQKGLAVDLVIWNEDHAGYRQLLQDQIMGLIAAAVEAHIIDKPGGIFVRPGDQIPNEDRILLQSVARVIIADSAGTLSEQINRLGVAELRIPRFAPAKSLRDSVPDIPKLPRRDLIMGNGLGGFTPDGREYVITLTPDMGTPAPWVNVLANPEFGSIVSESGQAYTWGENAHEFRLTPWGNDAVGDPSGEAFYLRDESSGQFWSPTAHPCGGLSPYIARHGFGYSVFEHSENGIDSELWVYVALDAPVKFFVWKIRNESGRSRELSATGYVQWVLGDLPAKSAMHIVTEIDPGTGALFARNAYNTEFTGRTAFFDLEAGNSPRTISGDRKEFLGRNGTLQSPAALKRLRLSGKVGAGLDPCAAIQTSFELKDGQEREFIFRLGVSGSSGDASQLIQRLRGSIAARGELDAVRAYWLDALGSVQIETPDRSLDILANGWLMYQTLACRLWARSGHYQSGGAFGFRDQLQDVMALVYTKPQLVRDHLLRCAAHQFVEGDVQHWWHPPSDRGVRTKCSDDYLWLPLAVCRYVASTGDLPVLDESAHFLEGRPVNPDEDSYYDLPIRSGQSANLYQHCVRAIERSFRYGRHGLPLIGSCDWNDGMDKVGEKGRGESVWLGFFLFDVLKRFADLARTYGDSSFAQRCDSEAGQLQQNLDANGWDGAWYRRAYFDDGRPLGSSTNSECQIDSISQSWSVLSAAANPVRARTAMSAVDKHLVRRDDRLIQLLDPPFEHSDLNPGYIRGYPSGVRENGGQYTHASIWAAMAFAKLGDRQRTWDLLQMINPMNHGCSARDIAVYKVEPYVVAADVYAVSPHIGRGGWTWYTGSSGWMYRLILESLLGLRVEVDQLSFVPCLPPGWNTFTLHYRYRSTMYHITVVQEEGEDDVPEEAPKDMTEETPDDMPGDAGAGVATGAENMPNDAEADVVTDAEVKTMVESVVYAAVCKSRFIIDGIEQKGEKIRLVDDQKPHTVIARIFVPPTRGGAT